MTEGPGPETKAEPQAELPVWDIFVRVFHWTLAAAFFLAHLVEDEALLVHVWAGYLVGGLILLRLPWGLLGPRHARFSSFLYGPRTILDYLAGLLTLKAKRYLGHSPAGGVMVIALLLGLAATVWSGLEVYAIEENAGPLASNRPEANHQPRLLLVNSREDGEESLWEEFHEAAAKGTLLLVILHIVGVLWATLVHRENLIRAMFTGRKRAAANDLKPG